MEKEKDFLKCCYKTGFVPKKVDSRASNIFTFLCENNLANNPHYVRTNLKNVINSTAAFYSEAFESLHSVLTISKSTPEIYSIINNNVSELLQKPFVFKEYSPFEIPIILKSGNPFYGSIIRTGIQGLDINPYSPFIITHINLSKPFSTYTIPCYTHEIMHSQVDTIQGAVTDYHNLEVLPIFMEKLNAYFAGSKVFHEIEKARLYCLLNSMSKLIEEDNNRDYIYYSSTLKAEKLFDMYVNSSDSDKKVIMDYIQMIINGEISLEEFLEGFGITLESSLDTQAMKRNLHL